MSMIRAMVRAQIKALGEDQVEVRMSTATIARDGHILIPQGVILDNFRANPVVLWNHDVDSFPVGRAEQITVQGDDIVAIVRFPPPGISPRAEECRGLVKAQFINGVSVGFDPLEGEPLNPAKPRAGMRVTSWELFELSFCCVPVDPEAVVTARAEEPSMNRSQENVGMTVKTGLVKAKHTRALEGVAKDGIMKRGLYEVANLAYMLENFGYAHACSEWEAEVEGDDSPVPAMLGEALVKMGEAFLAMSKEEVSELLAGKDLELDEDAIVIEERAYIAAGKTPRARAWRRGVAMTRAGKALSSTNQTKLEAAQESCTRAIKHNKTAATHGEAIGAHMDAITDKQSKANKAHDELGDALKDAKNEPEKATEHVARAVKAHKALGGALGDMSDSTAAAKDTQADATDSTEAVARHVGAAQRCMRAVVEGSTTTAEDKDGDVADVQTSAGTKESEGSENDRAWRRRQSESLALRWGAEA